MSVTTVAVLIPTYNRPRCLAAALASVAAARADQCIVVDDGSTYDVAALCADYPVTDMLISPPMTPEERMRTPRQGRMLNRALELVRCDATTLLCDDDLFHPGWLDALRAAWKREPGRELVRGDWLQFADGDIPSEADPPCPLDRALNMTAGNFAWHTSLTRDRGVRWDETAFNCLDAFFLNAIRRAKVDVFRVPTVGLAGWRREHPLVNGNYSMNGNRHTPAFLDVLRAGYLEAAR